MYLFALHTITHLGYKERTKLILNPSQQMSSYKREMALEDDFGLNGGVQKR